MRLGRARAWRRRRREQGGLLSDAEGRLGAWEFELAFRDLLRRYTQVRGWCVFGERE
jgi:hypothetical protein